MAGVLAAAGIAAAGGVASGVIGAIGTAQANTANKEMFDASMVFNRDHAATMRTFNADEAQKARDYSERMSNTAYQRQSADMTAAGVNPMLAIMKGGGASTPSAAQASGGMASAPAAPQMKSALASGLSSGLDAARLQSEIQNSNTNRKATDAGRELTEQNKVVAGHAARKLKAEADIVEANKPALAAEAKLRVLDAQRESSWDQQLGKRINGIVQPISSAVQLKRGATSAPIPDQPLTWGKHRDGSMGRPKQSDEQRWGDQNMYDSYADKH